MHSTNIGKHVNITVNCFVNGFHKFQFLWMQDYRHVINRIEDIYISTQATFVICVTNDHGYVSLVVSTSRSFPHSWLSTGFREVQELPTLPDHLSSLPFFNWVSCYSIFSFICMICRSLFLLLYFFSLPLCCLFFFDLRILITSLWYLLTLLIEIQIIIFSVHHAFLE